MIQEQKDKKLFVSTFCLVVIDLVGFVGMLSPYQDLFLKITPFNLLSSALLLFYNHKQFNKAFFIFCVITFLFGFFIEVIGVRTGIIFGQYAYGNTLGPKILDAPILIGLNWLMLVYSAGIISHKLNAGIFFKSCFGAILLVILDVFMEPIAIRSDFWSWHNGIVPAQNYIAWFITSFLLLMVFHTLNFNKINKFAPILYIVQFIFFALLSALCLKLDIRHYTYLSLIGFTIFYPLLKSFENKIKFADKWEFLFPAILINGIVFIVWDIWFTSIGIWKFNPDYVLGLFVFNLPIEEWLFFIVVPFACVFIYEVINYFVKRNILAKHEKHITNLLAITLLLIAMVYNQRLHTFITFLSLSIFLFIHQYILKSTYLGKYYIAWAVCLVPFAIVNGVLTAMPVLIYNNSEIIGLRLYTIPIEDVFYGMLMCLLVVTVYEWLKQRNTKTVTE